MSFFLLVSRRSVTVSEYLPMGCQCRFKIHPSALLLYLMSVRTELNSEITRDSWGRTPRPPRLSSGDPCNLMMVFSKNAAVFSSS